MPKLLDKINGPEDLKKLKKEELIILAAELREVVLETEAGNLPAGLRLKGMRSPASLASTTSKVTA